MPAAPFAGPELHRRPALSRRWVLHLHLVAAPLTANLHTCTSHGRDCTALRVAVRRAETDEVSYGPGETGENTDCARRGSDAGARIGRSSNAMGTFATGC